MHRDRQLRLRVLEALDDAVKSFRRREELWPLRVPAAPLLLDDIVERALGDEAARFEPRTLRTRPLMRFEWEDGSTWDAWVAGLPSGLKLYGDTGAGESRILASGGRNEGDGADRAFLQLLAESGGGHFGIEMAGGAPASVRTPVGDDEFVVSFFVELFEVLGAEASVHAQLRADATPRVDEAGIDFRTDVERWLARARG